PVGQREAVDLHLPTHDCPEIADYIAEGIDERRTFASLAVVEGDALGILPQAHQTEPEIRFEALLVEIESDQRSADQMREPSADGGVDQRRPEHVSGDGNA